MPSDAEQIRVAARAVSGLAGRARAAGTAVTGASHARWESLGARRYREQLGKRRGDFHQRARELDELSKLLISHAAHVEAHEAAITKALLAVENSAHAVADEATTLAEDARKASHDARPTVLKVVKTGVLLGTVPPLPIVPW